jgi:hypothetical protein
VTIGLNRFAVIVWHAPPFVETWSRFSSKPYVPSVRTGLSFGNLPGLRFFPSNTGHSIPIGRPVVQRFSPIHF